MREPEEVQKGDGVSRWQSAIVVLLLPEQQLLAIISSEEEAALLAIPEMLFQNLIQAKGCIQILGIKYCLIKLDQSPDEEGIIIQIGRDICSLSVAMHQASIRRLHHLQEEVSTPAGCQSQIGIL